MADAVILYETRLCDLYFLTEVKPSDNILLRFNLSDKAETHSTIINYLHLGDSPSLYCAFHVDVLEILRLHKLHLFFGMLHLFLHFMMLLKLCVYYIHSAN